jgi:hypothetical protein
MDTLGELEESGKKDRLYPEEEKKEEEYQESQRGGRTVEKLKEKGQQKKKATNIQSLIPSSAGQGGEVKYAIIG